MPVATPHACGLVDARARELQRHRQQVIVYSINVPDSPLNRGTFTRREHAEKFLEALRRRNPELSNDLRVEEQVLEAGGVD